MGDLELGRYRFRWISEASGELPGFIGPALRGGLGHVLRKMVCVTRLPQCAPCLLRYRCAYPVLFEPFAPPEWSAGGRYARPPVPFVLRAPPPQPGGRTVEAGDVLEFEMGLLGQANGYLPYYLLALVELGRHGLGRARHRFRTAEVSARTPSGFVVIFRDGEGTLQANVPPQPAGRLVASASLSRPDRVTLRFASPVRLDLQGDLVYPVEFEHLVRGILERLRAVECLYGTCSLPELPPPDGVRRMEDLTRWIDLSRYSSRQRTEMRIGGAMGTVTYEGDDLRPFAPLLVLGEWIGVGKLTSMGLGQMEVIRS